MKLTVIGCYGPYPPAGGCCSGYLLQDGGYSVLLDCGNGVLSRLRYYLEPWELAAVIISHLHSDHFSDVMILRYAMMIYGLQQKEIALPVYAPTAPQEEYQRLSYKSYLKSEPLGLQTKLCIGKMHFTFTEAVHSVPSYMITVTDGNSKFVYSSDTEYTPKLAEAAAGADLFLCEANYLHSDLMAGGKNHLAAFQAAEAARAAQVKKMVLTHHHPERMFGETLREAREIFPQSEAAMPGSIFYL